MWPFFSGVSHKKRDQTTDKSGVVEVILTFVLVKSKIVCKFIPSAKSLLSCCRFQFELALYNPLIVIVFFHIKESLTSAPTIMIVHQNRTDQTYD